MFCSGLCSVDACFYFETHGEDGLRGCLYHAVDLGDQVKVEVEQECY